MKPKYTYKGLPVSVMKIKHVLSKAEIEAAIGDLLINNEKVNKKAVIEHLQHNFWAYGSIDNWYYSSHRSEFMDSDFLDKRAEQLGRKLFKEFYNN